MGSGHRSRSRWRDATLTVVAPGRRPWWVAPAAALLVVLGIKLAMVGLLGSPAPFWDQWNGEGDNVIVPYVDGRFGLADLLYAHNDHRVVFTRLLTLALLELNGGWNPISEMAAGAFIHVAVLGMLVWLLRDAGFSERPAAPTALLLLLFAFPFAVENTLWGFQSQFYFLLLLSLGGLVLVVSRAALSVGWLCGATMGAAAFLAMAPGLLAPAAAAAVSAVQLVLGARGRTAREVAGIVLLGSIVAVAYHFTVSYGGTDDLKARSPGMFLSAFGKIAGWPLKGWLLAPLLLNGPVIAMALRTLVRRARRDAPEWRTIAIFLWLIAICLATAFERAGAVSANRYVDLLAILSVVNLAALLMMALPADGRSRRRWMVAGSLWAALLAAFSTVRVPETLSTAWIEFTGEVVRDREASLTRFVTLGDPSGFRKPGLHSPYSEPEALVAIAAKPEIRGILPAQFGASDAEREAVRRRLWLRGGLRTSDKLAHRTAFLGELALLTGLAILAFLFASGQLASTGREVAAD